MYDLTINSASFPDSTLVVYTLGSKNTSDQEGAKEGLIYNRDVRGQCNRRLTNIMICLSIIILFCNGCTNIN